MSSINPFDGFKPLSLNSSPVFQSNKDDSDGLNVLSLANRISDLPSDLKAAVEMLKLKLLDSGHSEPIIQQLLLCDHEELRALISIYLRLTSFHSILHAFFMDLTQPRKIFIEYAKKMLPYTTNGIPIYRVLFAIKYSASESNRNELFHLIISAIEKLKISEIYKYKTVSPNPEPSDYTEKRKKEILVELDYEVHEAGSPSDNIFKFSNKVYYLRGKNLYSILLGTEILMKNIEDANQMVYIMESFDDYRFKEDANQMVYIMESFDDYRFKNVDILQLIAESGDFIQGLTDGKQIGSILQVIAELQTIRECAQGRYLASCISIAKFFISAIPNGTDRLNFLLQLTFFSSEEQFEKLYFFKEKILEQIKRTPSDQYSILTKLWQIPLHRCEVSFEVAEEFDNILKIQAPILLTFQCDPKIIHLIKKHNLISENGKEMEDAVWALTRTPENELQNNLVLANSVASCAKTSADDYNSIRIRVLKDMTYPDYKDIYLLLMQYNITKNASKEVSDIARVLKTPGINKLKELIEIFAPIVDKFNGKDKYQMICNLVRYHLNSDLKKVCSILQKTKIAMDIDQTVAYLHWLCKQGAPQLDRLLHSLNENAPSDLTGLENLLAKSSLAD